MMLKKNGIKKLEEIFDKLLKTKKKNYNMLEFGITRNWDSLKHIQLILNIEEIFEIKVKTPDVFSLTTFEKIVKYLKL